MATVGKNDTKRPRKSLRGAFYEYDKGDRIVVSGWPKPRGAPKTERQRQEQERFKNVCRAIKLHHSAFMAAAYSMVEGTPFLPRDPIMAAMYGKGPQFVLPNGERLISMATRVNMSEVLDNIEWTPGSMLFRGQNLWIGIPPGQNGQVLTYQSANEAPVWGAGPGTAGAKPTVAVRTTDTASSGFPRYGVFESTSVDENTGCWNAATPDRLFVPEGATRVRLTAGIRLTPYSGNQAVLLSFEKDDGIGSFPGQAQAMNNHTGSGFTNMQYTAVSAWLPASLSTYYRVRINVSGSPSLATLADSWFQMEVV